MYSSRTSSASLLTSKIKGMLPNGMAHVDKEKSCSSQIILIFNNKPEGDEVRTLVETCMIKALLGHPRLQCIFSPGLRKINSEGERVILISTSIHYLYEMAAEVGLQRYNTKKGFIPIDVSDIHNFANSDNADQFVSPSDTIELLRREISSIVVPPTFQIASLRGLNLLDLCSLLGITKDIFPLHKMSKALSLSNSNSWNSSSPPTLHIASYLGYPLATCVHFIAARRSWFFLPGILGGFLFLIKAVLSTYYPPPNATSHPEAILDSFSTNPPSNLFEALRDGASVLGIASAALLSLWVSHQWPVLASNLTHASRTLSDLSLPISVKHHGPSINEVSMSAATFGNVDHRLVMLRLATNLCDIKDKHPHSVSPPCDMVLSDSRLSSLFNLYTRVLDGTYHRDQEVLARAAWFWVAMITLSSLGLHFCWNITLPPTCSYRSMIAASLLQVGLHQVVRRVVKSITTTRVGPALRTNGGLRTSYILISDGIPLITFVLAAALSSSARIAGCTIVTNIVCMMLIRHHNRILTLLSNNLGFNTPAQLKKNDDLMASKTDSGKQQRLQQKRYGPDDWVDRATEESIRPVLSVEAHLGYASSQLLMTLAGATVWPPVLLLSYFDTFLSLEAIREELLSSRRCFNENADVGIITWCLDITLSFTAAGSALVLSVTTPVSTFFTVAFEHALLLAKGSLLLIKHIIPTKSHRLHSSSASAYYGMPIGNKRVFMQQQQQSAVEDEEVFCFEGLFFPQPRMLLNHAIVDKLASSAAAFNNSNNGQTSNNSPINKFSSAHGLLQHNFNSNNKKSGKSMKGRSVYKHISVATSCVPPPAAHSVHFCLSSSSHNCEERLQNNIHDCSYNKNNNEEELINNSPPASPIAGSPIPTNKSISFNSNNNIAISGNVRIQNTDSSASTIESKPAPPLPISIRLHDLSSITAQTTMAPVETPREAAMRTPAGTEGGATPCVRKAEQHLLRLKRCETQQLRRLQRMRELRMIYELCNVPKWEIDLSKDSDAPSSTAFSLMLSLKGIGWLKRSTMAIFHPQMYFELRGSARQPVLSCVYDFVVEDIKFEMPLKCSSTNILDMNSSGNNSTNNEISTTSHTSVHDATGATWSVSVQVSFTGPSVLVINQNSRSSKGTINEQLTLNLVMNSETNEIEMKTLTQHLHIQPLGANFHTASRFYVASTTGRRSDGIDLEAFINSDLSPVVSTVSSIRPASHSALCTSNVNPKVNSDEEIRNQNPIAAAYNGIERIFIPEALLEYLSSEDEEEDEYEDEYNDSDPKIRKMRVAGMLDATKIRTLCDSGFSQLANGFTHWGSGKMNLQIFKKESSGGKPLISIGEIRIPVSIIHKIAAFTPAGVSIVEAVTDIIWDVEAKVKYDPMMSNQILLSVTRDFEILYQSFHGVCGSSGRDMILRVVRERVSSKRNVIAVSSIPWTNDPLFNPTCERATAYLGGFDILEEEDSSVLVRLINQVDLGGSLPEWIQKVAKLDSMKGLSAIVLYMEKELSQSTLKEKLLSLWATDLKLKEDKEESKREGAITTHEHTSGVVFA